MKPIEDVIRNIEGLYPIDSEYQETRTIGKKLLEQAKRNANYKDDWRDLHEIVIREYERLCIQEDNRIPKSYDHTF